jgi:hypothetical protein
MGDALTRECLIFVVMLAAFVYAVLAICRVV